MAAENPQAPSRAEATQPRHSRAEPAPAKAWGGNPVTDHLDVWTSALLTKSTAGRGSNGKLEAYGIKKLRELILGTALRGLFDKKNESLPRTIEQDISKARNAYYKSIGKKPKEYDFGPALLNEFDLPSGWAWKRVGDLCDLQTGATPSTQNTKYYGGDVRWLVSGDINQGIIEDCEGRITEDGLINSNCKLLPQKTVLIAINGQGKTRASVALLNVPAACNQSLVGMIPFDASILDSVFLLLSLRYRYYEIREITGQNQRRGLNMGLVAELSIPLPPLAEQHRIVAKVDELMAQCDQLEQQQTDSFAAHQTLVETLLGTLTRVESQQEFSAAWARIASHFDTLFTTEASIDQLKQTLLQLAVMGKLVPQDPNDEPASELLKRIHAEKTKLIAEGKIKKDKLLAATVEDEIPFELPQSWEWICLLDLMPEFQNGVSSRGDKDGKPTTVLRLADIKGRRISLDDTRTIPIDSRYIEKYKLLDGDILITRVNGSADIVGSFVLNDAEVEAIYCDHFIRMRIGSQWIDATYLCLLGESSLVRNRIQSLFITTAGQKTVNQGHIGSLRIALPPLAEQHRIVAKVDELMALCDALKARLADAQTTQLHLADAIVEQAVC
jgi:type I restriction enzyme S subunit